MLGGRFGFSVADGRDLVDPLIEADEQIDLVGVFRNGVAAESQFGVSDPGVVMANVRLERHADILHVVHDHLGENGFRIRIAAFRFSHPLVDLGADFSLGLMEKVE